MTYTINFSSNTDTKDVPTGKETFTILDRTTNNKTSTSLILHGKGISPFGQEIWQNMVWMLENFCGESAPLKPTVGQLWYDNGEQVLKIYKQVISDAGTVVQDWYPLETSANSTTTLDTVFFKDENGRTLNDRLTITGDLLSTINLKVTATSELKNVTVSGTIESTDSSTKYNSIQNSDKTAKYDLFFTTKKFTDDFYLKGIHSNDNEFDASGDYNKRIILPAEVHLTGTFKNKDNVVIPSGISGTIDISGSTFSIGNFVHIKGYKGASDATFISLLMPCAMVRTGHRCTLKITYFDATGGNARGKKLFVKDMVAEKEIMWAGGNRPTLSASGTDVFEFVSIDGQWYGSIIGQAYSIPAAI